LNGYSYFRKAKYVHGDSHYFRIDKPFLDSKGQRIANFSRVETFGDHQENGTNDCNWLKVFVNPDSREGFTYQQQIVPANKVVPGAIVLINIALSGVGDADCCALISQP
jgi:hypothetical protein